MNRSPLRLAASALVILSFVLATSAPAQYFGRNKVQWEDFDFHVLRTPHFDLHHYPPESPAALDTARMAERWYRRLSTAFGHEIGERRPIILYADHADFRQTNIIGGFIGEGTGGFAEPYRDRLVLPLTGVYANTHHVLGHELVHAFQFDIAGAMAGTGRERIGLHRLPLWMVEGLAEYLSQGRDDTLTAMWMRDAVLHDDLPTLRRLSRDFAYNPYRFGQAFWAYVGGRWGDRTAVRLFTASLAADAESLFPELLGVSVGELEEQWHEALRAAYEPVLAERRPPAEAGEPLITAEGRGGRMNLAPAVSPDGRRLAFLSTRELFSVDLFLADAQTGRVERRSLFSADRDAHFDSLAFIDSSGSWSPDSRRLAFVGFRRGTNELVVMDVERRRVERRLGIPGVGGMSNPAWSPDGSTLVVSGMRDGVSDLYLIDVASGAAEQLTDDRHAALQPAFSPDGRTVAYLSDRRMDLEMLTIVPLEIHLLSLDTREVRRLPLFEGTTHIDPQFSADGSSIYFVADPDGVPNIYRHRLATGATERLTHVATGVAGITQTSPALSVSPTGDLYFSVFNGRNLEIYRLDAESARGAATPVTTQPDRKAAILPPAAPHPASVVEELLADFASPLPPDPDLEIREYRPRLGLDLIGPVGIGVFGGEFGYGVAGGVSAYFSDMLGDHQLAVAVQGGSATDELGSLFGAEAFYANRSGRLQWGAQGAYIPLPPAAQTTVRRQLVELDGEPVLADVYEQLREQIVVSSMAGLGQYPLSQTRRWEASTGFTHYGFDRELERLVVVGGTVVGRQRFDLEAPESLSLYQGSVAFVGDNSSFGFISPVRGGRMRVEGGSTWGDLEYTSALADARRYFYRRPLTLAVRGLHFGRYGGDAERLSPLFVGSESLVRGYSVGSFSLTECTQVGDGVRCPEFDRLVGTRIGVVNAELRVPLFGTDQFGLVDFVYLPTELSLFVDGGVAWTADESPRFDLARRSAERIPVFSAGVAARILLLGALPIELFYAFPFQRPERDGVFGVLLRPGW